MLELCASHLVTQGHKYCIATSVQKLKSELIVFTESPVPILLISLRLGSKGINITCANHVIFADVCPNIHDEVQAIGRCHRIGQLKPIKVYHIFMKASIEDKIFKQRIATDYLFSLKRKKTFTGTEANRVLKFTDEK